MLEGLRAAAFGFVPSMVNAMNDGEIGTGGKDEQSNGKRVGQPIQKRADNQQTEAFGTLPKTDTAAVNQGLRAGLRVTDHDGTGHSKTCEQRIEEAVDGGIVNEEAHENGQVRVAVQDGFQKCSEEICAGLTMGEGASEKITSGSGNHGKARREKAASAEKNAGEDAKSKTAESEETCRDACPGES